MADEASLQRRPAGTSSSRPPVARLFTALELAAAEQLIHLSESSCSSALSTPRGGGKGMQLLLPASAASSSTTSPRSVNNAPPPPPAVGAAAAADAAEDDDEQEVGGRPRRNKRYRSIAEIYAATEPNKPIGGRRRKADQEVEARK